MPKKSLKSARFLCTACGDSLDDFCFSEGADDIKAILQRLAVCKKEGKFAGHFCARLFIASSDGSSRNLQAKKVSPRKVAALRASIVQRIGAQGAASPKRKSKARRPGR
jgi:hypothetical protein